MTVYKLFAIFHRSEKNHGRNRQSNQADDKFRETLINLIGLASGALETFKGSTIEEKRKLINLLFGNLKLKC